VLRGVYKKVIKQILFSSCSSKIIPNEHEDQTELVVSLKRWPLLNKQRINTSKVWNTVESVQLLCFWTLGIIMFLFKTHISETGFCLHLQVEPTQLGPIKRASPSPIWTPIITAEVRKLQLHPV
jgi:hypothetical protein